MSEDDNTISRNTTEPTDDELRDKLRRRRSEHGINPSESQVQDEQRYVVPAGVLRAEEEDRARHALENAVSRERSGICRGCASPLSQRVAESLWLQYRAAVLSNSERRMRELEYAWLPTQCSACDLVAKREDEERQARMRTQHRRAVLRDELQCAGVPRRLIADLSGFEPSGTSLALRESVTAFVTVQQRHPWLTIIGPKGSGKTTEAARAIVVRAARRLAALEQRDHQPFINRNRDRFVTIPALLLRIFDSFRGGSNESKVQILREYMEAPLLVLDDLGTEKPTEHTVSTMMTIIDHRYAECLPMIITTNLPKLSAIGEHLAAFSDDRIAADRIVDRLAEMAKVVEVKARSFRPAIGQQGHGADWYSIQNSLGEHYDPDRYMEGGSAGDDGVLDRDSPELGRSRGFVH